MARQLSLSLALCTVTLSANSSPAAGSPLTNNDNDPHPVSDSQLSRPDPDHSSKSVLNGVNTKPTAAAAAKTAANYTIRAKLDPDSHQLKGQLTLRFVNGSSKDLDELWFHLYLNAFKNERTLFLRPPSRSRSGTRGKHWGFTDVHSLHCQQMGPTDLWQQAAPHSPDDPNDQTDIRVPLPKKLAAGDSMSCEIEFLSQLPNIVERTGFARDFHMVAQWFPKLARLEDNGHFAHFAFHPNSEFYADFGDYDVTLNVPQAYVVGATGQRHSEQTVDQRKRVRFTASRVHDFAWTAWPSFQVRDEQVAGIQVRMLFPEGQERNAARSLAALKFTLPAFNRDYGAYPYPTLTVVHPPHFARPAGGMEYPTLITTGAAWYSPPWVKGIEAVTVHELGHQWFYGLIATDEHRSPFLDEGLTSYAESKVLTSRYGAGSAFGGLGFSVSRDAYSRAAAAYAAHTGNIAWSADRFPNFRSIGALVYARTPTVLHTLGAVYGREKMTKALSAYTRAHRFAHPEPQQLFDAINDALGPAAADNAELAITESGWVDYAVTQVSTRKLHAPAGIFDKPGKRHTVTSPKKTTEYTNRALIERRGTLRFPTQIRLRFEDGSHVDRAWDGQGRYWKLAHTGPSRLVSAQVDPTNAIGLDQNLTNNARRMKTARAPRLFERLTYWLQLVLSVLSA